MSTHTATVDITTEITATLHIMRSIQVRHLPVLAEGRLVGMVSFDDLLRCVSRQLTELADVVVAARRAPTPFHRTTQSPPLAP